MKTIDWNEDGVRRALEQLPVGSIAALAATALTNAQDALHAAVVALEVAQRVDPHAATWAVPVVANVRRARPQVDAAGEHLLHDGPTKPDEYSTPIGGEA